MFPYTVEGFKREYKVGEVDDFVSFVFSIDHYPLMFPFDSYDFSVELSELGVDFPDLSPDPSDSSSLQEPEPFSTLFVAIAVIASAVAVGATLMIYFKKRKR